MLPLTNEPYQTRAQIKAGVMARQKLTYGYCKCFLCKAVGTDMHEIVSRNRTMYSEEVRQITFQKELCSLLCQPCHSMLAVQQEVQTRLLAINVALYGLEAVKSRFEQIPPEFTCGINFPE